MQEFDYDSADQDDLDLWWAELLGRMEKRGEIKKKPRKKPTHQ